MEIELPVDWELRRFSEIVSENKKSQLKVSDASNFGPYKFYTSGENILQHHKFLVEGENVFLATGGVANVKYDDNKVAYSTDTYSLKVKDNSSAKLLYYHLLNDLWYINYNYFEGSGLKHLQKKELRKHLLPYPNDYQEQQKIAEILTKMDDAIANTQAMIDKYENIKKGLMQDLLTKGIDENGNIRSEETHKFKDSPLGRIPVEWELSSIADLGNWKGGKTPSKSQPRYWEKGSVLWFSSKDITEDTLSNSFYKISRNAVIETNQTIFPAHKSLIFVFRSGILRHTFPIAKSKSDFTVNQDIKVLLPRNKIKTDFLFFLFKNLESIILKSYVKAGTTVESIDGKAFFKIDVGIPDEIEQQRIIDVISTVYENINNKKLELEKLKIKKIGLMQDLLSGKVRVPN